EGGSAKIVKTIMDNFKSNEANKLVIKKDGQGMTVLHKANEGGRVEVVEALLSHFSVKEQDTILQELLEPSRTDHIKKIKNANFNLASQSPLLSSMAKFFQPSFPGSILVLFTPP